MTPAQEAREYAAANGFTITPNGRRYTVSYPEAQHDTFVADVGGYPAALNAMRKYVDALKTDAAITDLERIIDPATLLQPDELCAGGTLVLPKPGEGVTIGTDVGWKVKTPDEIKADIISWLSKMRRNANDAMALQFAKGVELDAFAAKHDLAKRAPGQTDIQYRNVLLYGVPDPFGTIQTMPGAQLDKLAAAEPYTREQMRQLVYGDPRGMKGVDFPFEDTAGMTARRITAKTIRKKLGVRSPQPMTHAVVMRFKSGTHELAYPSYRDAVTGVRQVLSGLQKRYHPSFVTIRRIGA